VLEYRRVAEPTVVYLVPHTHWDREWYRPFQSFRMELVDLVDRILELLKGDPRFRFTLDGQLATVDDYLEVRPEAEAEIRMLVAEGRLSVGPWQFLMDEFLV
jgi:2-O-(6-phospho-alpha-D-mannosyl)-D-glycerate hydrolase